MARTTRSEWQAHQDLALGAAMPPRKPRPLPMRSRRAQRAAAWGLVALLLLWGGVVLLH